MKLHIHDTHRNYLERLETKPEWAPAEWPIYMVELYKAGYIQKIGKSMYLTEKGHECIGR